MAIVEVNAPPLWKTFHKIPHDIYKNIKHWVSPLHEDIESILHPDKHKISGGEVISWIYFDDQNKPQGRISAFIDHDKNKQLKNLVYPTPIIRAGLPPNHPRHSIK